MFIFPTGFLLERSRTLIPLTIPVSLFYSIFPSCLRTGRPPLTVLRLFLPSQQSLPSPRKTSDRRGPSIFTGFESGRTYVRCVHQRDLEGSRTESSYGESRSWVGVTPSFPPSPCSSQTSRTGPLGNTSFFFDPRRSCPEIRGLSFERRSSLRSLISTDPSRTVCSKGEPRVQVTDRRSSVSFFF